MMGTQPLGLGRWERRKMEQNPTLIDCRLSCLATCEDERRQMREKTLRPCACKPIESTTEGGLEISLHRAGPNSLSLFAIARCNELAPSLSLVINTYLTRYLALYNPTDLAVVHKVLVPYLLHDESQCTS